MPNAADLEALKAKLADAASAKSPLTYSQLVPLQQNLLPSFLSQPSPRLPPLPLNLLPSRARARALKNLNLNPSTHTALARTAFFM
jgi:hypothetical protein